jgi:hypothetical protein
MYSRYWLTTSNPKTKQHSRLGNTFLISNYTQPLVGNAFAKKTLSHGNDWNTTTNGVFYALRVKML